MDASSNLVSCCVILSPIDVLDGCEMYNDLILRRQKIKEYSGKLMKSLMQKFRCIRITARIFDFFSFSHLIERKVKRKRVSGYSRLLFLAFGSFIRAMNIINQIMSYDTKKMFTHRVYKFKYIIHLNTKGIKNV